MNGRILRLTDGILSMAVLPQRGGKTLSIVHGASGQELLYQKPGGISDGEAPPPGLEADFADGAWGWDDCWPSVTAGGPGYPDHGALWRLAGTVGERTDRSLTLSFEAPRAPWRLKKTWTIGQGALSVAYAVENRGASDFPGFFTLHALVRTTPDMVLRFPQQDVRKTVYGDDFSPDSLPPVGTCGKFWLPGPVERGEAGIDYPSLGMGYRLSWNPQELPYLGFWVTNGGFRGEHNAAWEPSDGWYDSVETAGRNGALPHLAPGACRTWGFQLRWAPLSDLEATTSPGTLRWV